jgi:hypothetical protein
VVRLSSLKPESDAGTRPREIQAGQGDGVGVKTPSSLTYDIAGRGFTRLRGMAAIENREITNEISPRIRFFIYKEKPNMARLTPVEPATPLPAAPVLKTASEAVDRVFWYALGRAPSPQERLISEAALANPAASDTLSAEGLADLLWAVFMKPEFQLIY